VEKGKRKSDLIRLETTLQEGFGESKLERGERISISIKYSKKERLSIAQQLICLCCAQLARARFFREFLTRCSRLIHNRFTTE